MRRRRPTPSGARCTMGRAAGLLGLAVVVLLGGCRLLEADDPLVSVPGDLKPVPVDVNPPQFGPLTRQPQFAPGTLVPVSGTGRAEYPAGLRSAAPTDAWTGTSRGVSPPAPGRHVFPDLPPAAMDAEPKWVLPKAPSPAAPAAPLRPPVILEESAASKSAPPEENAASPKADAKSGPAALAANAPPLVRPPLPIPVPPDRPSARGQMKDDSVIVAGVAIPMPPGAPSALPVPKPPAKSPTAPAGTAEPPIRLSDGPPTPAPTPDTLPPLVEAPATLPKVPAAPPLPAIPLAAPGAKPVPVVVPPPSIAGPIEVGGQSIPFDALANLVDGGDFGTFGGPGSCSTCEGGPCGPGQCRAGGRNCCEFFPARGPVERFIKLIYECICCPDPCYQPHWEPIADAAFFTDAPRPVTQTRVRWDYGAHLIFPDRGEFFWPRADGSGKGPKPNPPARGTAYLDYHELSIQAEAAAGPASVTIVTPYRSVNPFPFANSAAGFGDVTITAKNILYDCELFIFSFQMRTYIPSGNFGKGLGVGHMSLEPGLISGIRIGPNTYAVAEVVEWIPLGGEQDYQGAHLRFNFSFNQILWRPVKDIQLIGTFELNGINWQDGAFTDPVAGPLQKLSGETAIALGCGARLFFCDKFDFGIGGMFGATGKYWAREQMRFEVRYRF